MSKSAYTNTIDGIITELINLRIKTSSMRASFRRNSLKVYSSTSKVCRGGSVSSRSLR